MNRFTTKAGDELRYEFWLTFSLSGEIRMVRGRPQSLDRDERAMAMTASLPLSLFRTPEIRASITIPDGQEPSTFKIDVEAAATALKGALGVDIDLVVHPAVSQVDDALAQRKIDEQP